MDKNILDTINRGVNIASKMVTKGVGEVTKTIKPTKETAKIVLQTGLFYKRCDNPTFGRFIPSMDFFEPQYKNKMVLGVIQNITLPQAERAFTQAGQYLLLGKDREATDRYEESVRKDPQLTDGYYVLGCLYLSKGSYRLALENFKKVMLLQQTINRTIKKYIPSFKMILNITHNSCFTFFADLMGVSTLLALAMRAEGLREGALEGLSQMLGVMPSQPVLLFFEAAILYEIGAFDRVIELLKDVSPDSNIGYLNLLVLGRALISLGDTETAREVLKKGMNKEEMDPELYLDYKYSLGLCDTGTAWAKGRSEEIEKVFQMKPDYQDVFQRLGLAQGVTTGAREKPAQTTPAQEPMQPVKPPQSVTVKSEDASQQQPRLPEVPSAMMAKEEASPKKGITSAPTTPRLLSDDGSLDITLEKDCYVIGREAGDIVLNQDASASKQHAKIIREGSLYFIEDIGSTNGTWVNQFRISKKVNLNRGDLIVIGKTRFRFG